MDILLTIIDQHADRGAIVIAIVLNYHILVHSASWVNSWKFYQVLTFGSLI
jgi:hypothetical protein